MIIQQDTSTPLNNTLHQDKILTSGTGDYPVNFRDGSIYFAKVKNEIASILDNLNQANYQLQDKYLMSDYEGSQPIMPIDQIKILSLLERKKQLDKNALNSKTLTSIAEWEGYIDQVKGNKFYVKMVNIKSNNSLPEDRAVFSVDEVSEHDQKLLKEGAYVRFVLGRERLPSGQIRSVSQLYFRRLPAHSMKDYCLAKQKAKELLDSINWIDETKSR